MARIRTIKPDFWSDEKIVELTPWARLLFIGLWNFSDDYGRMPFSPKKIKMLVFPGDDVDVSSCLEELSREDLIRVYERDGRAVSRDPELRRMHQKIDRKTASKFPAPVDEPLPDYATLDDELLDRWRASRESFPKRVDESSRSAAIPGVLRRALRRRKGMEGKGSRKGKELLRRRKLRRRRSTLDFTHS